MIDDKDRGILNIIQSNARVSNVDVARQLGMAPSAVLERLRKLEARGIIRGYEARLDPKAMGQGLLAFVFVKSDDLSGKVRTGELIAAAPEVLEVHQVAGEDCFLVKVRVADTEALGRFLRERFGALASVHSTRTTIVLETLKETGCMPVGERPVHDAD